MAVEEVFVLKPPTWFKNIVDINIKMTIMIQWKNSVGII